MRPRRARSLSVIAALITLIAAIFGLFNRKPRLYPLLTDAQVIRQLEGLGIGIWVWLPSRSRCDDQKCPCHRRYPPYLDKWAAGREHHFDAMSAKAKQYNVGHVLIKGHDGSELFEDYDDALAHAFTRRGVKVLMWGYNYCIKPREEGEVVVTLLHKPSVAGYVFNTEGKVKGKSAASQEMLRVVCGHQRRCKACSRKLLGYAPFAYVQKHRSLPYEVYSAYCNFVGPQVYWKSFYGTKEKRPVRRAVNTTFTQWTRWERDLRKRQPNVRIRPLIPIGQAYHPRSARVTPQEMIEFAERTKGYHAIQFYAWHTMTPKMWVAVKQAAQIRHTAKSRRMARAS